MKKGIIIFILSLVIVTICVIFWASKKDYTEKKHIESVDSNEIVKITLTEESEGGYTYYQTENKELIEKIVKAIENIKIGKKVNIMVTDSGEIYTLEKKDGSKKVYYFQGGYYNENGTNYEADNYNELKKIKIPKNN